MKIKLSNFIESFGDGIHGTPFYNSNGDYYFINGNNLVDGEIFLDENVLKIDVEEFNKIKRPLSNKTLLLSINGSLGNVAYYNFEPVALGKSVSYINLKDIKYKDFVYYLLSSTLFKKYMLLVAGGSTIKNFSPSQILDFEFEVKDNIEIEKIGQKLKIFDRKIKINKNINLKLGKILRLIYNQWFLSFDFPDKNGKPYKSSGGDMVWNEELKREIPINWETKKLKDIVYLGNDKKYNGPNIKTIDMSVMPSNSISLNELNDSDNFETNLFKMKKYDILFGSIRPYLKKAGIAPCDGAFAGTVYCFRCYNDYDYNFALETLTSENMFDYACKNSKGSKMPVIGADRILEYPVPYNEEIVRKFNSFDFKKIIVSNIMQNQELASLRDFLLPLLMNGQVKFKD